MGTFGLGRPFVTSGPLGDSAIARKRRVSYKRQTKGGGEGRKVSTGEGPRPLRGFGLGSRRRTGVKRCSRRRWRCCLRNSGARVGAPPPSSRDREAESCPDEAVGSAHAGSSPEGGILHG